MVHVMIVPFSLVRNGKILKNFSYHRFFSIMSTSNCIFCNIVAGTAPATVIYQDPELIVFKDIKPVTKHHFLIVPKQHYDSINVLNASNISLVEKMVDTAKQVLEELGGDLNEGRLGFHCPPFNSIKHLHLHCLSPVNDMSFLNRLIFRPNTWWFCSADQAIENLKSKI